MLNSLNLENFKPFENQSFVLRPLTLLSGLNSTGKSSLLQSLLLLRQSYQQNLLNRDGLALNGELVSIGTARDALFNRAEQELITFTINNNDKKARWVFDSRIGETDLLKMCVLESEIDEEIYKSSLFTDKFHYLKAERMGPRKYFEMSHSQVKRHNQIGTQGEFAAHFLEINENDESEPTKVLHDQLLHSSSNSDNLKNQVEAWLGEISPGTRLDITPHKTMDLINLQYADEAQNIYRSTNVGFGITYTLPIIVAVLSATVDTLILLENPESHLHPKGQSKIGELIALAANSGVQIIVETHSDHILNGIRKVVRNHQANADKVQIYYFQKYLRKREVITEITSPKLYPDGGIDKWPDGFFDQAEKDLMELL